MSIADHFEHAPDAGFVRNYDKNSARRQFNVSLILIVVIAAAAFALGAFVQFDRAPMQETSSPMTVPTYVGSLSR